MTIQSLEPTELTIYGCPFCIGLTFWSYEDATQHVELTHY